MKTPLDTRGSRANDGGSARLGKKQPDGTHVHRIAHSRHAGLRLAPGPAAVRRRPAVARRRCGLAAVRQWSGGAKDACEVHAAIMLTWQSGNMAGAGWSHDR